MCSSGYHRSLWLWAALIFSTIDLSIADFVTLTSWLEEDKLLLPEFTHDTAVSDPERNWIDIHSWISDAWCQPLPISVSVFLLLLPHFLRSLILLMSWFSQCHSNTLPPAGSFPHTHIWLLWFPSLFPKSTCLCQLLWQGQFILIVLPVTGSYLLKCCSGMLLSNRTLA